MEGDRVAEPGHYRRLLFSRTGLDVQENQARRLWGDMASFRGYLEQKEGRPIAEAVAANRWLTEVYDPVANTWTEVGSLNKARAKHTGTLIQGGRVLVVGGLSRGDKLSSSEVYQP